MTAFTFTLGSNGLYFPLLEQYFVALLSRFRSDRAVKVVPGGLIERVSVSSR